MRISGTTRVVGLFGFPVNHTLSPIMHNRAFENYNIDTVYLPLEVSPNQLNSAVEGIRAMNFIGANVTLPHKNTVVPFLDTVSELSRLIGVVNTIVQKEGQLHGTTTDPYGFLQGFKESGHSFQGKTVAVIGSGGSARTICYTLLHEEQPSQVFLVARNIQKSMLLSSEIQQQLGKKVPVIALADYVKISQKVDILVQCSSVGMTPHINSSPLDASLFRAGQVAYDIIYTPEETLFLREAKQRGLHTVSGLGMLVYQGIASFKLWTGIEPDPALFYESIRSFLNSGKGQR